MKIQLGNAIKMAMCLILLFCCNVAPAQAFCGFFVAKADATLHNASSRVIIARSGDRTVFTMANDYQGRLQDFARIVPIPVIPKRENVRIGDNEIIDKLDEFTVPRLAQYFDDRDRLLRRKVERYGWRISILGGLLTIAILAWRYRWHRPRITECLIVLFLIALLNAIALPSFLTRAEKSKTSVSGTLGVTVEDRFALGEYNITILSAEESDGLATWLVQNGYQISDSARSMLQDYIDEEMKFFVVNVNLDLFDREYYGFLRPIVLDYNSDKFALPIRLGTLNATDDQDLIVYLLSPDRFAQVANYKTVTIPTDTHSSYKEPSGQELPAFIADEFPQFYEALFQQEYERQGKNAVFLEYAGRMDKCDPCASLPPTPDDLLAAGAFWEPGGQFPQSYITRLHVRYNSETFPEDLQFEEIDSVELIRQLKQEEKYASTSTGATFQGRYVIRRPIESASALSRWHYHLWDDRWARNLARLTGWDIGEIRDKMTKFDREIARAISEIENGENLEEAGRDRAALAAYTRATELDRGNYIAWRSRAYLAEQLGRCQEAWMALEQLQNLGFFLGDRDRQEWIQACQENNK